MQRKPINRKSIFWLVLIILAISIRIISSNPGAIETYYSGSIYPKVGSFFRFIFGWIPFSVGDILYGIIIAFLVWKLVKWIQTVRQKKPLKRTWQQNLVRALKIILVIYILFNLFWGLNYNRQGIKHQIGIKREKYSKEELASINRIVLDKLNACKESLERENRKYPTRKELFRMTDSAYRQLDSSYPFLRYSNASLKSSFFGWLGNWIGFTGYFNPLTGEAQANTTVPNFLLPYICCHEVAHQLGYAKENEANFVGYLIASKSGDSLFMYSTYFDLFLYANRNLYNVDSVAAKALVKELHPGVKNDILILREFLRKYENPIEPAIRWMYGKYLEANQQPSGVMTYNEVIADVIAYYRKYKSL